METDFLSLNPRSITYQLLKLEHIISLCFHFSNWRNWRGIESISQGSSKDWINEHLQSMKHMAWHMLSIQDISNYLEIASILDTSSAKISIWLFIFWWENINQHSCHIWRFNSLLSFPGEFHFKKKITSISKKCTGR